MGSYTDGATTPSCEEEYFKLLSDDAATVELDTKAEAKIVHVFDSHRSAVEPWFRRTGIEEHT